MMSKNLYFKLMKEDIKNRLWAVALVALGCFFLYPVSVAFMAGEIRQYANPQMGLLYYAKQVKTLLSFDCGGTVFAMVTAAMVCGLSSFSYLNSKKKVDFYHSIPVRRERLFLVNYIDGILILAVPYLVSLLMAGCIAVAHGVKDGEIWPIAAAGYGLHMTYFILTYTTVVLAVMLTGNLVVSVLGCMVLIFVIPAAASLIQSYFSTYFRTYSALWGGGVFRWLVRISPVTEYVMQTGKYSDGLSLLSVAAALGASLLLALIALFLYRKRASEAAGKAMAFPVTQPLIRVPLVLLSALCISLLFWSARKSTGWAVFGSVCGGMICHCIMEIIYHFDFKKLFAHGRQLAGCLLAATAVVLVFRYDLTGYDTYLPSAGTIENAAIRISLLDEWVSRGRVEQEEDGAWFWRQNADVNYRSDSVLDNMEVNAREELLEIVASGIAQIREKKREQNSYIDDSYYYSDEYRFTNEERDQIIEMLDHDPAPGGEYAVVLVRYTLKNGKTVYRCYHMNLEPVSEQIAVLVQDSGYQDGTYPVLRRGVGETEAISYLENQESKHVILPADRSEALLEAYQQELRALTLDTMRHELPIGLIRFMNAEEKEALAWHRLNMKNDFFAVENYWMRSGMNLEDVDYYPVYPSFKQTIQILKEGGIDAGSSYINKEVSDICVSLRAGKGTTYLPDLPSSGWLGADTTDPKEMKELLYLVKGSDLTYYNSMFRASDVSVDVGVKEADGTRYIESGVFRRGAVPEYIKERMK